MSNLLRGLGFIVFSLIFSLNSFAKTSDVKAIDNFMRKFLNVYEHQDLKALNQFFLPTAIAIGTGSDEAALGKENIIAAFNRDFKESTGAKVSTQKIALNIHGNVALASYYLNVRVNLPNNAPYEAKLRWTMTLIKENNQWYIAQSHLSAPLESQKQGESFPHSPA